MKELIAKITLLKNITGLFSVVFYLLYVMVNFITNKGNAYINVALLVLSVFYLFLYIYSVFIIKNRKIKKVSRKFYINGRKFIGTINALLVITSTVINDVNSLFSIIVAIITIIMYLLYLVSEMLVNYLNRKIQGLTRKLGWKHDYRN